MWIFFTLWLYLYQNWGSGGGNGNKNNNSKDNKLLLSSVVVLPESRNGAYFI